MSTDLSTKPLIVIPVMGMLVIILYFMHQYRVNETYENIYDYERVAVNNYNKKVNGSNFLIFWPSKFAWIKGRVELTEKPDHQSRVLKVLWKGDLVNPVIVDLDRSRHTDSIYVKSGDWVKVSRKIYSEIDHNKQLLDRIPAVEGWVQGTRLKSAGNLSVVLEVVDWIVSVKAFKKSELSQLLPSVVFTIICLFVILSLLQIRTAHYRVRENIKYEISNLSFAILVSIAASLSLLAFIPVAQNGILAFFLLASFFFSITNSPINLIRRSKKPYRYKPSPAFTSPAWILSAKLLVMCIPWFLGHGLSIEEFPNLIDDVLAVIGFENFYISVTLFCYVLVFSTVETVLDYHN